MCFLSIVSSNEGSSMSEMREQRWSETSSVGIDAKRSQVRQRG